MRCSPVRHSAAQSSSTKVARSALMTSRRLRASDSRPPGGGNVAIRGEQMRLSIRTNAGQSLALLMALKQTNGQCRIEQLKSSGGVTIEHSGHLRSRALARSVARMSLRRRQFSSAVRRAIGKSITH